MIACIDTHAHLDGLSNNPAGVDETLQRAADAGVDALLAVGGNPSGNRFALACAHRHPDRIRAAVGFDRDCAGQPGLPDAELEAQLADPAVAAIGEAGLDYHYSPDTADAQESLLSRMLDLAAAHRLPVVIHVREAEGPMAKQLEAHAARWTGAPDRIGVIHCFAAGEGFARRALACGFHLSFSGIVTFPGGGNVRAVAAWVPENRLLVETDTPYLAPTPHRGKRNEPAYVVEIVHALARLRGVSPDQMAAQTTANARRLFGFRP